MEVSFHPFKLSKDDTLKAKGIAVVLLLWHHLFYTHPEMPNIVYRSACWAKVCVHLFLFLSGYGLFFSYSSVTRKTNGESHALWLFYKERFIKLMPRYWIVFLLCVPICIIVFNQFPADVFPGVNHLWLRLTMQFFGIHMLVQPSSYGYNPTWWFMTLILLLYLIFPFLFLCVNNLPIASLILFTLGCYLDFIFMPVIEYWLIPFVIGIVFARLSSIEIKPLPLSPKKIAIITLIVIIFILSISFPINHFGIFIASFQAVTILYLVRFIPYKQKVLNECIIFIGKHSFNIFLLHTFLNHWFFFRFIYKYKSSAIWALPLLLASSILCSIGCNSMYNIIFARK